MGTQHDWVCTSKECDCRVEQVSGGFDRGFKSKTETRICSECKYVHDYHIGLVSDHTHTIFSDQEHKAAANPEPLCRRCYSATLSWDKTCPTCGSPMAPAEDGWSVRWD